MVPTNCTFCSVSPDDAWMSTNLVVAIPHPDPIGPCHLLVAPRAHKGNLSELDRNELVETMETLRRMVRLLDRLIHPDGYNIGLNLGRAAGAGLPGHLHWHLVPRWAGDTNFMPILSNTKVISQSLDALYDLLVTHLQEDIKE